MKILMVLTSHDQLGNTGRKTGVWLEEFASPYFVFRDAGVQLFQLRQPMQCEGSFDLWVLLFHCARCDGQTRPWA
jgi:hypothetical protein